VLIELAHYKEEPIPENEGKLLAERIGAVDYVECSALTQKNLKEVFDTAIIAALSGPIKRNRSVRRSKKEKKLTSPPVTSTEKNIKKNSWKRFCCFL
jgi:GTPase SAR1 family protein